ncbi:MAG: alpha/beta fold hydrolase [Dehalococcoidia bacterium]
MPTARINGIDLWYDAQGSGPTLVLSHGFAGPTPQWPPVIDAFRERVRLVLYDARGHGSTSVPPPATFSLPQFAADLAALLDHLDIERAHIGGVSMGGMISAQFACDYPERVQSLLLCDTTAGNGGGDPETVQVEEGFRATCDRWITIVEKHGMKELVEREVRYRHERDQYAALAEMSVEWQDAKNRRKLEVMTDEGYIAACVAVRDRPDLTARTPLIVAPTLVSCGEWDDFYPCASRDHGLIRTSRFATVRRAAHSTPDYRPQLWKQAVFEFIDDVEAGRDVRGEGEYGA